MPAENTTVRRAKLIASRCYRFQEAAKTFATSPNAFQFEQMTAAGAEFIVTVQSMSKSERATKRRGTK